jgi:hypothetical protein
MPVIGELGGGDERPSQAGQLRHRLDTLTIPPRGRTLRPPGLKPDFHETGTCARSYAPAAVCQPPATRNARQPALTRTEPWLYFGQMAVRITKPYRATHTYRQRLHAAPAKVFPLLCPVREAEWAEGWSPELVISSSGFAERDGIFITSDEPGTAIWYITRHEPEHWHVEMLKILPGVTACRLNIQLSENGNECFADITYSHTSLGPAGDKFVAKFKTDYYQKFMQAWEKALNHFLTTGCRLADDHAT